MKIAYVHTGLWPSNSPSTTFATYNSIGLSENFETCYFFIKKNSDKTAEQIFEEVFGLKKPDNLEIRMLRKPLFNSNKFYYGKIYRSLSEIIKENRLDVIITRNVTFLPYLISLKIKFGLKVFYETHDFFADLSLRDDIDISKKRKQERIEKKYIPELTGLICLQQSQADLYTKVFPGINAKVFRTGINQFRRSNEKRKYVTYVGSLDPLKGVETLIKALSYCKTSPELLIVGGKNSDEIEKTKAMIKENGIVAEIKITGWVNKNELDNYLQRTLIGILPTTDTFFNRYLTSPLKLFDYYSYGIPVIASDLPANRELIEENSSGLFFDSGCPEMLAEKIDFLMINREEIERMRDYIYDKKQELLWSNRGKKMKNWISDMNVLYEMNKTK